MSTIDDLAFSFVSQVQSFDIVVPQQRSLKQLKGDGTKVIANLSQVQNIRLSQRNPATGEPISHFKDVNGQQLGLAQTAYKNFREFIHDVALDALFKGRVDFDFVEDHVFEWLLEVYQSGKATSGLESYLLDRIAENNTSYTFNFKMSGLSIEEDISIGETVITALDESDAKQYWETVVEEQNIEDDSKSGHESFEGVFANIRVIGIYSLAKKIALRKTEIAVDVLKSFCAEYSLNPEWAIPDLSHRTRGVAQLNYWHYRDDKQFAPVLQLERYAGIIPLQIDKNFIARAKERGLDHFVHVVSKSSNDELYSEIIICIQRYADIASTSSHYEKIVKAVSLLEGPISPRPSTGKNRGESRIKDCVIPKLTAVKQDALKTAVRYAYEVRNAYIHNCQFLPTDVTKTRTLLEIIRMFILRLAQLHDSGKRNFDDIGSFFSIS